MKNERTKTLAVAVDFGDNLVGHEPSPKRMYTPDEVMRMTQYFHELGVRRLYWFHNAHDALFEQPFGGARNLLEFACELQHVRQSNLYDGFILYEAAGVMGIDEDGRMHTSTALKRCLRENWEQDERSQESTRKVRR